ncbi:MAG: hypothetical protein AAFY08_13890 [Planctomycetota bacterium]
MTPAALKRQHAKGLVSDALRDAIVAAGYVLDDDLRSRLRREATEATRRVVRQRGEPGVTGQVTVAPKPSPPTLTTRPGSLVKWGIWKLTGEVPSPRCRCAERARLMDEWGWSGCWKRRREIIDWFVSEAAKRGHPIKRSAVRSLLLAAWREMLRRGSDGGSTAR